MKSRILTTAALAAGLAFGAAAQDLGHKAPAQAKPIMLTNVSIHPVAGDEIENGWILFDGGNIVALGAGVVDVSGKTAPMTLDGEGAHVWPGLISPCSQLGLTEIGAVRATHDFAETQSMTPEVRAAVAVNPDSTLLPVTRSNGILLAGVFPTARLRISGPEPLGLIPGRAALMRLDGWTWEDMAVVPDAGLVVNFPLSRPVRAWWMDDDESEQTEGYERAMEVLGGFFESAAAYHGARAGDESLPTDLRYEAVARVLPGAEDQLPVFFRANDYDQIVGALNFAGVHGLEPVIVGGRDSHLCLDLLKSSGAAVILESSYRTPKRDDSPYDDLYKRPQQLEAAGIPYTFMSGDDTAHERSLPYAVALAVAHGLDPDAGVRAITLSAAEIFGVGDRYGSLEPGKSATLIVTDGHPLDVLSNVELAFIDGRAIDLENKQTKLAEKYREKYRQLGLIEE